MQRSLVLTTRVATARWVSMVTVTASLVVAALSSGPVQAKVPTKLKPDPERGRDLYQDLCWQCHGPAGLGDGPLSEALSVRPPSLRDRDEATWPELLPIIGGGRGDMPAFAESIDRYDSRRILVWLAALDQGETKLLPTRKHASTTDVEGDDPDGDLVDDDEIAEGDPKQAAESPTE